MKVRVQHLTDVWGGKNYGTHPIKTPGQSLQQKLNASQSWQLVTKEEHIDTRNDNQCDIHRGSDFTYRHCQDGRTINVYMKRSRSGKTVDWEFHCDFEGDIF